MVPAAVPSNYGDDIFEVLASDGGVNNLLKPGSVADAHRGSNRCGPNVGWVIEVEVDKNTHINFDTGLAVTLWSQNRFQTRGTVRLARLPTLLVPEESSPRNSRCARLCGTARQSQALQF